MATSSILQNLSRGGGALRLFFSFHVLAFLKLAVTFKIGFLKSLIFFIPQCFCDQQKQKEKHEMKIPQMTFQVLAVAILSFVFSQSVLADGSDINTNALPQFTGESTQNSTPADTSNANSSGNTNNQNQYPSGTAIQENPAISQPTPQPASLSTPGAGIRASTSAVLSGDLVVSVVAGHLTAIYQGQNFTGTVDNTTGISVISTSNSLITKTLTFNFSINGSVLTLIGFENRMVYTRNNRLMADNVYTFESVTGDPSVATVQSVTSTSPATTVTTTYLSIYNDPANPSAGLMKLVTESSVISNSTSILSKKYYSYDTAGNITGSLTVTPASATYQISEAYAGSVTVNNRTISATANGDFTVQINSMAEGIDVINQNALVQTLVYFQGTTKKFTVEGTSNRNGSFSDRKVVVENGGCESSKPTYIVQGQVDQLSTETDDIPIRSFQQVVVNGVTYDVWYGTYQGQQSFVNMPANAPSDYGLVFAKRPADASIFNSGVYSDIVTVNYDPNPNANNVWLNGAYYSIAIDNHSGILTLHQEMPPEVSLFVADLQTQLNNARPNAFTVDGNLQADGSTQIRIHSVLAPLAGQLGLMTFKVTAYRGVVQADTIDARYAGFINSGCNGETSRLSGSMLFGAMHGYTESESDIQTLVNMSALIVQSVDANGAVHVQQGNKYYNAHLNGAIPTLTQEPSQEVKAFILALQTKLNQAQPNTFTVGAPIFLDDGTYQIEVGSPLDPDMVTYPVMSFVVDNAGTLQAGSIYVYYPEFVFSDDDSLALSADLLVAGLKLITPGASDLDVLGMIMQTEVEYAEANNNIHIKYGAQFYHLYYLDESLPPELSARNSATSQAQAVSEQAQVPTPPSSIYTVPTRLGLCGDDNSIDTPFSFCAVFAERGSQQNVAWANSLSGAIEGMRQTIATTELGGGDGPGYRRYIGARTYATAYGAVDIDQLNRELMGVLAVNQKKTLFLDHTIIVRAIELGDANGNSIPELAAAQAAIRNLTTYIESIRTMGNSNVDFTAVELRSALFARTAYRALGALAARIRAGWVNRGDGK